MMKPAYYYQRPIGVYTFVAVASTALVIKVESTGSIDAMSVITSVLVGLAVWGFGNIVWSVIGDVVLPYIYGEHPEAEYHDEPTASVSDDFINQHISKHINGGSLWAKGMSKLENDEEEELRKFFLDRWTGERDGTEIPSYISRSLLQKLETRGIAKGNDLTTYGEKILPLDKGEEK